MRPDVLTLHRFYESAIGNAVCELIHARISTLWSIRPNATTYGLGFALPYLDRLAVSNDDENPQKTFALMPAAQGVCHWPSMQNNATTLVDEYHLPLADSAVERLLVVHALEHTHRPAHFFREIWRVLAPGGQVVVVTPNRRRTWSALDTTPFGHGRPYSRSQIYNLMKEQMLPPETWDTALMLPPFRWPGVGKMMRITERTMHALGKNMGGALIVSARKQVYGALPKQYIQPRTQPVLTGFQKDLRDKKDAE
ncbi:class I SAM-dependent methyltransferase [Kordiimonas aquimaris]|uniref:class I SAM-dependent methyltransferase n=1 Tax=Kordiimonas aquimaris TaxID=707591 RepID=UPI0021CF7AAC|nr:class I SAM-dependent methyltransferase [Kordiimonas aquimaris]